MTHSSFKIVSSCPKDVALRMRQKGSCNFWSCPASMLTPAASTQKIVIRQLSVAETFSCVESFVNHNNNNSLTYALLCLTPNDSNDRASKGPFTDSSAEFCTRWLWHSLGVSRLRRAHNESHDEKNIFECTVCHVVELPEATCVRDHMEAIVVVGVMCCSCGGLDWGGVLEQRPRCCGLPMEVLLTFEFAVLLVLISL